MRPQRYLPLYLWSGQPDSAANSVNDGSKTARISTRNSRGIRPGRRSGYNSDIVNGAHRRLLKILLLCDRYPHPLNAGKICIYTITSDSYVRRTHLTLYAVAKHRFRRPTTRCFGISRRFPSLPSPRRKASGVWGRHSPPTMIARSPEVWERPGRTCGDYSGQDWAPDYDQVLIP